MPREMHTAEEREMLTEEELEGLKELEEEASAADEGDGADPAADPAPAEAKPDGEEQPKPDPDPKPADPAAVVPAPAAADPAPTTEKPADPEAPAPAPAPAAKAPRPPFPVFERPKDADTRIKAIDDQLDALAQKFDDGELTAKEMREQQKTLEAEQRDLRAGVERANLSQSVNENTWFGDVAAFLEDHKQYTPNSSIYSALDAEVRRLQTEAMQNGSSQFDKSILETAHANIQAAARALVGAPEPATKPKPQAERPAAKREIPPTLGGLPAADISNDDGGEFAVLDRLADTDRPNTRRHSPSCRRIRCSAISTSRKPDRPDEP